MDVMRTVKYEAELDQGFSRRVMKHSGCDKISECIQCGTCSSTCPVSLYMDYTPRKIMAMIKAGFKHEALRSHTLWLCSSCYSCTVMCPAQIKITDVMYSLKRMAIEEGIYPKGFPTPVLAKAMADIIAKNGRNSEMGVVMEMSMKTNPLGLLKMAPMGLALILKGRMEIKDFFHRDKIKNRKQLQDLVKGLKGKEA
jgi:quinone-modifying oxidoreductase, subunit QmoC